jgi:competence protein ComEC
MFDLRKIPLLRVLLPFFGGIFTGLLGNLNPQILLILILQLFLWILIFVIFKWQGRKAPGPTCLLSLLIFVLLYLSGIGTGIKSRPLDPDLPVDQLVLVRGILYESPRAGRFAYEFEMQVQLICSADGIYRTGTVLKCYMPVQDDSLLPALGETWQFSGKLSGIRKSGNPGMPDYRAIMGRKNCWYRFSISSAAMAFPFNKKLTADQSKLAPANLRHLVSAHWQGNPEEISLLKAVCLGDRSSLSDDLRQAYTAAGGMHLLAVSGLHVGLIWCVLQYLTAWMSLIFRKQTQRVVVVVGLLWFYAFMTGFSSSVCRSVTMFSFFSLGRLMGDRVHPLNAILVSAFLLVLKDPLRLMDIGFQLSYAAITGIIAFHPIALKVVRVENRVLRWIWEAGSVSLAAQLATMPLVIYYFHKLPLYSLVTSLVAIPMLSFLIAVFVCSVPFVSAGILESFFSFLLVVPARFMNRSVEFVSQMPGAILDDLHLELPGLLIWILIIILVMIALHGRKRMHCYLILALISFSLVWHSFSGLNRRNSSELVISNIRGASMLSLRVGKNVDHYCWYRDSTSLFYMNVCRDLAWNRRMYRNRVFEEKALKGKPGRISFCIELREGAWLIGADGINGLVINFQGNTYIPELLSQNPALNLSIAPDFMLLSGEPPVNKLQMTDNIEEMTVVIDGSNRSWYKETIFAIPGRIYLTDQAGAYVKRW